MILLSKGTSAPVASISKGQGGSAPALRRTCRIHGVTLRDEVRSCGIRKTLNVEPLLRIERYQLRWFGHVSCPECRTKDWRGKSCWPHPVERGPEVVQGPGGVITSPTLHGPVLVLSQQTYLRLLSTVRYLESSYRADAPARPSPEEKWARKRIQGSIGLQNNAQGQLLDFVFMATATSVACQSRNAFSNCMLCTVR